MCLCDYPEPEFTVRSAFFNLHQLMILFFEFQVSHCAILLRTSISHIFSLTSENLDETRSMVYANFNLCIWLKLISTFVLRLYVRGRKLTLSGMYLVSSPFSKKFLATERVAHIKLAITFH